jgi:hypothetical protein
MPEILNCTVPELVEAQPCVKCASRKDLFAVMIYILAEVDGYSIPDDTEALLAEAACFSCLSDREKLNVLVTKLISLVDDEEYEGTEVFDDMKCLLCIDERTMKAILTLLICKFIGLFDECQERPV